MSADRGSALRVESPVPVSFPCRIVQVRLAQNYVHFANALKGMEPHPAPDLTQPDLLDPLRRYCLPALPARLLAALRTVNR